MKTKQQPSKLVAFSVETTKEEMNAVIAGFRLMDGCISTSIRSLGDRVHGWNRWEVRAFFPYSEALADQDGAVVCI
jgi:hypothetical protein